jgi:hypothetical protein
VDAEELADPRIWRRLLAAARTSPGRLDVPVAARPAGASDGARGRLLAAADPDDAALATVAGADVLTDTPAVVEWLAALEGRYTLGTYVYADGATHARAAVAVDALTAEILRRRDDVDLAFLATPTDAFVVPPEAVADSRTRYGSRSGSSRVGGVLSAGRLFAPNYPDDLVLPDGGLVGLNDSLVRQQGPNYALAKRVQRWRAVHERAAGRRVSLNVAPATRTRSVLRNRVLAAAYAGAHRFGVDVFEPQTSNTLLAALLVHDLRNPSAPADPATPLGDPSELIWQGAAHGGLWRTAYAPRSVLGIAVGAGLLHRRR